MDIFSWIILGFIALVILSGLKILVEYERAVIFRLGRYKRVTGPGIIYVIPFFEKKKVVDLRIKTAGIPRQEVMTKDNIPVLANTVVYYKVEKPADSVMKIEHLDCALA